MPATSKTCTGCHQDLPLDDFQRDRKGKFGRVSRCRACVSARQGCKHIPRSKTDGTKICTSCLRELPLERFSKANRGKLGLCADCKDCQRLYREQNEERIQRYFHVYRQSNSLALKETGRAYYRLNADRLKSYSAVYRTKHPEVTRRASRNFHRNHPDRTRHNALNRRARRRGAEGHFTLQDILCQRELQAECCFWCSQPLQGLFHIDHVIPLARGGSNWADNLVIACPTCNRRKADKMPYEEWQPPNPLY